MQAVCAPKANQHPDLKAAVDSYAAALRTARRDRGGYKLFLAGGDLERLVRLKLQAQPDPDANPPLDITLIHAAQSLFVAHAGLVTLFPDVQDASDQIDQFLEGATESAERVTGPLLALMSMADAVFDEPTRSLTEELERSGQQVADAGLVHDRLRSAKRNWLKGSLASIGHLVLEQSKSVGKAARDSVVKEGVAAAFRNKGSLLQGAGRLLQDGKVWLLQLAEAQPSTFGWLKSLFNLLANGN